MTSPPGCHRPSPAVVPRLPSWRRRVRSRKFAGFHPNVRFTPEIVVARTGHHCRRDRGDLYAHASGLPISIQAGGHGLGPVTGGMLLTMRRFDRVEVDPVTRVR